MCVSSAIGFLLLTIGFGACGVGFFAPHWVYFPPGLLDSIGGDIARSFIQEVYGEGARLEYVGVLGRCYAPDDTCVWFWYDNFAMERDINDWHKAAQALYSFGYVILLSTLLLALLHLCCRCCCRKPFSLATVVGSLVVAGSMLVAAAIAVFMVFQVKEHSIKIEQVLSPDSTSARFTWGCFVAVGGVVFTLISAIFFICEGCRQESSRSYDGYETARTI